MNATGTFAVQLSPLSTENNFENPAQFGRMSIQKTFSGDLDATSVGEMLSCRFGDNDSAGYVAQEQVTGTLSGKKGRFVLQHFGIMTADAQQLTLDIIPGSGTDELDGITGSMSIDIKDGIHHYTLDWSL